MMLSNKYRNKDIFRLFSIIVNNLIPLKYISYHKISTYLQHLSCIFPDTTNPNFINLLSNQYNFYVYVLLAYLLIHFFQFCNNSKQHSFSILSPTLQQLYIIQLDNQSLFLDILCGQLKDQVGQNKIKLLKIVANHIDLLSKFAKFRLLVKYYYCFIGQVQHKRQAKRYLNSKNVFGKQTSSQRQRNLEQGRKFIKACKKQELQ